uniref:Bm9163, isoform a n=2 Tax=Brugia malayi TaxID=6279 RepID=A0A0J9XPQ2_BRUMA|nr:Bm9163, isoform a [Brugia malayi]
MSASINAENEAADQENVVASERDTSPPPAKVTRTDRKESISHPRKHLETVLSQRSEGSDEDLCAGDAVKPSQIDSDQSDSPAAESDRITPLPKFECNDSDSSEEVTQLASDCGDLLKDVENITESSDSSHCSPERTKNDEHSSGYPATPPASGELPGSSKAPYVSVAFAFQTTPCSTQTDRITSLRKRMAIYSPSDSMLSPCTMKLNRPKNFFLMRQKAKTSSFLCAEELSEENNDADDDEMGDEMRGTATGEADAPADDEIDKASGDDTVLTKNQKGFDNNDII